jgi:hypothetical protein
MKLLCCRSDVWSLPLRLPHAPTKSKRAVITFLWAEGFRSAKNLLRAAFCLSETCMIRLTCSEVAEIVSLTKNDQGARPHRQLKRTLNKSAPWFYATEGWVQVSHGSAYEIIHDRLHLCLCKIFRNNSRNNIAVELLDIRNRLLSRYHGKVTPFCVASSVVTKRGYTSMSWIANTKYGLETPDIPCQEVQISANSGKVMLTLFREFHDQSLNIFRKWVLQ